MTMAAVATIWPHCYWSHCCRAQVGGHSTLLRGSSSLPACGCGLQLHAAPERAARVSTCPPAGGMLLVDPQFQRELVKVSVPPM
jgi:hypothetical protein